MRVKANDANDNNRRFSDLEAERRRLACVS